MIDVVVGKLSVFIKRHIVTRPIFIQAWSDDETIKAEIDSRAQSGFAIPIPVEAAVRLKNHSSWKMIKDESFSALEDPATRAHAAPLEVERSCIMPDGGGVHVEAGHFSTHLYEPVIVRC